MTFQSLRTTAFAVGLTSLVLCCVLASFYPLVELMLSFVCEAVQDKIAYIGEHILAYIFFGISFLSYLSMAIERQLECMAEDRENSEK